MRILFITGEYPAMQGGVGDYTRELSRALVAAGADVHVLTAIEAGEDHLRQPAGPYEPSVYPILAGGWSLWGQALRLVRTLQPQIVHIQYQAAAYGMHPAINFLPARLRMPPIGVGSMSNRPRILTTFHDLKVPYLFPKAGGLRWQVIRALAHSSDTAVLTNPVDWARLSGTSLASRLLPIPIGSNIQREPPAGYDRDAQRARWGAGPGDWLLAYFGFLNANKGGETLVRCLAELARAGKPARLLMVGGQTGASDPTNVAYMDRVEALIARYNLASRVQWTGFTNAEQVSANLVAADCAVLPYREGATLRHGSLMAALAHGLPIVTTHAPGTDAVPPAAGENSPFPALVNAESALLVPPDDPAAATRAVTRIMDEPDLRRCLAQGALDLSHHFGWKEIAQSHMDAYRRLAG